MSTTIQGARPITPANEPDRLRPAEEDRERRSPPPERGFSPADRFDRSGTSRIDPIARAGFDTDPSRMVHAMNADLPAGTMLQPELGANEEEPWPATSSAARTEAPIGGGCNVDQMSFGEKVGRVLESAAQHLGPEALQTLKDSLPGALAGMAAYAGAHALGVGFIADVVGAAALGADAVRLVGDAIGIAKDFNNAKCGSDLDAVGQKLAKLASEGGLDLLLGALGKKLGKRHGNDTELDHFRSGGDPARTKFGPGRESHPEEWNAALERLRAQGVEVVFREGEMWYGPSPSPGKPGRLVLDPNASISALRHEMQHVADDQSLGYPGLGAMVQNPHARWQLEVNGYERELEMARAEGDEELVRELLRLKEEERQRIFEGVEE